MHFCHSQEELEDMTTTVVVEPSSLDLDEKWGLAKRGELYFFLSSPAVVVLIGFLSRYVPPLLFTKRYCSWILCSLYKIQSRVIRVNDLIEQWALVRLAEGYDNAKKYTFDRCKMNRKSVYECGFNSTCDRSVKIPSFIMFIKAAAIHSCNVRK